MAQNVVRTLEQGTMLVTNEAVAHDAGDLFVCGNLVVCHKEDQAISATLCPVFYTDVEVLYDKLSTDVMAVGDELFFDATNDRLTKIASGNKYAGICTLAAGNGVTTTRFALGVGSPVARTKRKYIEITGANAGGGAQSVTCTGAVVGDRVETIFGFVTANTGTHAYTRPVVGTAFESAITIVDKIQQLTTDYSTYSFLVVLVTTTS